jgi:hypothetical protein
MPLLMPAKIFAPLLMGDQTHVRQRTFQARDVQNRLGLEYYYE